MIDLFITAAESHVNAGRNTQARRVLEELRMLLGPSMKPDLAVRIGNVEERAQPGANRTAPTPAPDPSAESTDAPSTQRTPSSPTVDASASAQP